MASESMAHSREFEKVNIFKINIDSFTGVVIYLFCFVCVCFFVFGFACLLVLLLLLFFFNNFPVSDGALALNYFRPWKRLIRINNESQIHHTSRCISARDMYHAHRGVNKCFQFIVSHAAVLS